MKQAPRVIGLAILAAVVSAGVTLSASSAARAAGFDCTKAANPIETVICGDPVLDDLDDRLAQAFQQRGATGGAALRDDQRRWLASRLRLCGVPQAGKAAPSLALRRTAVPCLARLYHARLTALGAAPPVALMPSPPLRDDVPALPRLADAADNPAIERINRALAAADKTDVDDCTEHRDIAVTLLDARYLNLVESQTTHCPGAGGRYLRTLVRGYDLATGAPVDWEALLWDKRPAPKRDAELYAAEMKHDDPSDYDPDVNGVCGALQNGDGFLLWPDAKAGGIALQPAADGLPVAEAGCIIEEVVPTATLRQLDADAGLLGAIDQAHKQVGPPFH